ncbi:diguanylate cyclase [Paenibacillus wulumuqiensis]|uniref:diguanylate cyclase n=1 Tax=Paenibacillus wulumuqiensis TaxID=1567107 RepID=UPI0006194344|nr:diguanylate cyclase [Paenibacillus wulumuqiensis]
MPDHTKNSSAQSWRAEAGHTSYPVVPVTDDTFWLQKADISESDFLHIEALLEESLKDWYEQNRSIHKVRHSAWFLLNHERKYIGGIGLLPGQESLIQQIVSHHHLHPDTADNPSMEQIETAYQEVITIPLYTRTSGTLFVLLGCIAPAADPITADDLEMLGLHYKSLFYKRFEYTFVADMLSSQTVMEREAQRRTVLFHIIQRMYDKFEVDAIITEMFAIVDQMYPLVRFELLVSQGDQNLNPRVKPLMLQSSLDDMRVRTFSTGEVSVTVHPGTDGVSDRMEAAIPLMGKQGIYGVFHVVSDYPLEEEDMELLVVISEAAGRTFENARLYEQSQLLNEDLRLINNITQRLNQSLKLEEIFEFAVGELLKVFKAEHVIVLYLNPKTDRFEVVSGNVPALEGGSVGKDEGYTGLIYRNREPIMMSDYCGDPGNESIFMKATASNSMIASPLMSSGEVNGAIYLGHPQRHYFSYDNFKLLQVITTHIGLSVSNAALHSEVQRMASRDALTGLYQRRYLDDSISNYQSATYSGSLLMVDIDKFKVVNDTYGHQVGDEILKQVSQIIQRLIREGDIAARWGGEELAVYFPQVDKSRAYHIAENIRKTVSAETDPRVTVSGGVSDWNWKDKDVSVESLFYRADMALYQAKHNGRNQIRMDADMRS